MHSERWHGADGIDRATATTLVDAPRRRYGTPTGAPCPRTLRVDGTVQGSGDCFGCGTCLLGSGLV